MLKLYVSDRIIFNPIKKQGQFLNSVKEKLGFSWSELAKMLNLNERTVRDWACNKKHMSYDSAVYLSKRSDIALDKNIKILSWKEHTKKAGRLGGISNININGRVGGNETYRKAKWKKWWEEEGQYIKNSITHSFNISLPEMSVDLAEFVGIILGDGGITTYSVTVTLSSNEIKYISHVKNLFYKLFRIRVKVYFRKRAKAVDIVAQRKQLVDFCLELGLVKGNKIRQKIDIPDWIKKDESFARACVRGLIDTDGCFFTHRFVVNGKKYSYMKMAFTSASMSLVLSVVEILDNMGINIRISKNHKDVRIESIQSLRRYVKEVGSNNHKHLQKIKKWKKDRNMIE